MKGLIQEYNINPRKISAIISKKAVNFASATIGSSNYRGDDDGHTNKAVTNITVGLTKHAKEINFVCFEAEIDYFIEKVIFSFSLSNTIIHLFVIDSVPFKCIFTYSQIRSIFAWCIDGEYKSQ